MNASRPVPLGIAAQLASWASEIEAALTPLAVGELSNINDGTSGLVFVTGTPFCWSELPSHLHPQQAKLLEEYRRFVETLRVLLREQPTDRLQQFRDDSVAVLQFVTRDPSGQSTAYHALQVAVDALRRQVRLVNGLYSASAGTLLVPDTNALYWNTALDEWRVPDASTTFTVVLTPAVLKEVDLHKVDERNPGRRAKADRLARQIGEYRRRGSLLQGVPLVKGVSTIIAIPTEPRMTESLPWLDESNADDRLLASIIEIMRLSPRASVTVITRDVNFQNKLEFARIPFVSPFDLGIEERR